MISLNELASNLSYMAGKRLYNVGDIKPQDYRIAASEALEFAGKKELPDYVLLDIAFIRLKLYHKIELCQNDALLFQNAKEMLRSAPFSRIVSGAGNSQCIVVNRRDFGV